MNAITSPRLSVDSAAECGPNADDLADLLLDNRYKLAYVFREETPYMTVDAANFRDGVKSKQESIRNINASFNHEAWRDNIANMEYWEIEAGYWESCVSDQNRQGVKHQHLECFFKEVAQLDWRELCSRLVLKQLTDDIGSQVLNIIYHRHRSRYWERLCNKRGGNSRMGIHHLGYWRTEYYALDSELTKLQEETRTERELAKKRSNRSSRRGGRNGKAIRNKPAGVRKSARLSQKPATFS